MDLLTIVKDGWDIYSQFQQNHPHVSAVATAEAMMLAGDMISQKQLDGRLNPKKLLYTAVLAPFYGLSLEFLMYTGDIVGTTISENPLVKAALGPNLFGNIHNAFFFKNNTIGEKNNYRLGQSFKDMARHYASFIFYDHAEKPGLKGFYENFKEKTLEYIPPKEYRHAAFHTVTTWNGIQGLNYYFVPKQFRLAVALTAGTIWTKILTKNSLKGSRDLQKDTTSCSS